MSELKSACCNADIKAECEDKNTCCYICQKCEKPCNWIDISGKEIDN